MIRRTPTLIALNDNDVQDVREKYAAKQPALVDHALQDAVFWEEERKKKAAMTKEERLGMR